MTDPAQQDMDLVLQIYRIESEEVLVESGLRMRFQPAAIRFAKTPDGYPGIVAQVAQRIYDRFYTNPGVGRGSYRQINDETLKNAFARELGRAIQSREAWSTGWRRLHELEGRVILKQENGRVRAAMAEDFEATDGDVGRVRIQTASRHAQPGWFHVSGEDDHGAIPGGTVRLYWAISRSGAVPLIRSVTTHLNRAALPFHMKTTADPDQYRRADAAVLYFAKADWTRAKAAIRQVYADVGPHLRNRRPLFTKPLARGLGLAEEPLSSGSFGSHIAMVLAACLWNRQQDPKADQEDLRAATFAEFGVDHRRPWLAQPGEDYDTPALGPICPPPEEVLHEIA